MGVREQLDDGRLVLRRYRPEMTDALFEAARESTEHMHPWMPWCHEGITRDECREWVESRPGEWDTGVAYDFGIFEGDEYLGGCGINHIRRDHDVCNLGYWVRSGAARRGVATGAVQMLISFAFGDVDLWRIEIMMSVRNERSRKVAEKVGARFEGVMRSRLPLYDERHDARLYALLRDEG